MDLLHHKKKTIPFMMLILLMFMILIILMQQHSRLIQRGGVLKMIRENYLSLQIKGTEILLIMNVIPNDR